MNFVEVAQAGGQTVYLVVCQTLNLFKIFNPSEVRVHVMS